MKASLGYRILSLLLVFASVPLPGVTWFAPLALADDCGNWGGKVGSFGNPYECMYQAQDESRRRADDSQRKGDAERQRAQDAGRVAQRLDQDKGDANQQYQNPAMTPAQKGQFEQRPYQLPPQYSERYRSLSEFRRETQGSSLPPEPNNNRQLMSYDTTPLKELQQEQEQAARKEYQDAEKAMNAARNLGALAQQHNQRRLGMQSIDEKSGALLPSRRKAGPWNGEGDPKLLADEGQGLAGGNKLSRPGLDGKGSDITRSGITVSPGGRRLAMGTGGEERGRKEKAAYPQKSETGANAASDALARMESAKQLLAQRQKELAELERPRNGAESVIQDLQRTHADAPSLGGGRGPASTTLAREDEALDSFRASPMAPVAAETDRIQLSALPSLDGASLFDQVARQYRKRAPELSRAP